jgi:hypothetical protein
MGYVTREVNRPCGVVLILLYYAHADIFDVCQSVIEWKCVKLLSIIEIHVSNVTVD